jgi:hypothetical protein
MSSTTPGNTPAQDTPEQIAKRLELVTVAKGNPPEVWEMRDPVTGKRYFAKTAEPPELDSTRKAANATIPENSPVVIAKPLTLGKDNIPEQIRADVKFEGKRTEFLIVEAVPRGMTLGQLTDPGNYGFRGAPQELQDKPITAAEFDQVLKTIRSLNEQGVFHHDLLSNTEIVRGQDGKLKVYMYDFEPHTFDKMFPGQLEDLAHTTDAGRRMMRSGALATDAETVIQRYETANRVPEPSKPLQSPDAPDSPSRPQGPRPAIRPTPPPLPNPKGTIFLGTHEFTVVPARGGPVVATNNLNSCIAIEITGGTNKVVAHVSPEMLDSGSIATLLRAANVDNPGGEVKITMVGTDVNEMSYGTNRQKLMTALENASTETGVKYKVDKTDFTQKASSRSNEPSGKFVSSDRPIDPNSINFPKIDRPYAQTLFNANQYGYDKVPMVPVDVPGVTLPASGEDFFNAVKEVHKDGTKIGERVAAENKLNIKAQITSNDIVIDLYKKPGEASAIPRDDYAKARYNEKSGYTGVTLDPDIDQAARIFTDDRRRFRVLSASDLDPANEAKLRTEFKAYEQRIATERKNLTSSYLTDQINIEQTGRMITRDPESAVKALAAKYPGNKEIAEYTQGDKFDSLKRGHNTPEFLEMLSKQPEFQGEAGRTKLNADIRKTYVDAGVENLANRDLRKSVDAVLERFDLSPEERRQFNAKIISEDPIPKAIDPTQPPEREAIASIKIDDDELKKMPEQLRTRTAQDFETMVKDGRKALVDHAKAHRVSDPYAKHLSPADARAAFEDMYRRIPPNGNTRKMVDIALANPDLKIVVVEGADSNRFWNFRDSKDPGAMGFSRNNKNEIYLAASSSEPAPLLIEEALHNSIKNIYNNNTSHPFADGNDPRKALLFEAMRADIERDGPAMRGANLDRMRRDLGLESYKLRNFYAEAVVKLEILEAEGKLTPELAERYKHLNRFRTEILHSDAQSRIDGKPLPTIDPVEYRTKGGYQMDMITRAPVYTEGTGVGKKFLIPVESITGLQGRDGVESALRALGIPKEVRDLNDPSRVVEEGYRVVENDELRKKLGPGAKGTVIEIPEELLKKNPALYQKLTERMPAASNAAMLDESVGRQFRNNQIYEQNGVPRSTSMTNSGASERLLNAFKLNSETDYVGAIKTGRTEISLDPRSPQFEQNKQQAREVLEAHRYLTEERVRNGKPTNDIPSIEMEGNKLVVKLADAPDGINHEIARAQQLQMLMEDAPQFKASSMADRTISALIANRIQYQQKVEFFDSIGDMLSRKAIDPNAEMPNDNGTKQQQEFLKAAKAAQQAQIDLEAERAKPGSTRVAELEATLKAQQEKMGSIRTQAQQTHDVNAESIHNKQMSEHVRNTRASRVLNSTGVIQGAMTLNQIENDPSLSPTQKAIKRTIAVTHMTSGGVGVIVDTRLLTRPGSTLGVKFGTVTGVIGVGSSGYELYEAINADKNSPHYTRGIVMSSANLTASTLGTAGAITAWVSGGAGTAGAVGSGLMTASAAIAAPVALASLAFQLEGHAEHIQNMQNTYNSIEADIRRVNSQTGTTTTFVDIPGLKPQAGDYKNLDAFLRSMDRDKPAYNDGTPIDFRKLMENPKEFRRVAANMQNYYNTESLDLQRFLREGFISREDLSASPIGWLSKEIGGAITGRDIDKEYEQKANKINDYNMYSAQSSAAIQGVDGELPGGERNFGQRYNDYVRIIKPLEAEYPYQIQQLEKMRHLHIAMKDPVMQFGTRAGLQGMQPNTPEYNKANAAVNAAFQKDMPRYQEAQKLAAAEPKDMAAIQKFLGVNDEDWKKKGKNGKSLEDIITERARAGPAQLLPILNDHVKATSPANGALMEEFAKFNFSQEMKMVEPMLVKERAVEAQKNKTTQLALELNKKMVEAKAAGDDPEKGEQARKAVEDAKANLMAEYDKLQTAVYAESTMKPAEIAAAKENARRDLLRGINDDSIRIYQDNMPGVAKQRIDNFVQYDYESEAKRYFRNNEQFLEKSGLKNRPDVAAVGLARSPQEYLQKKMMFAPTLLVEQAKQELQSNNTVLATVTRQNAAIKDGAANAELLVRELTGASVGNAPILNSYGTQEVDKGVPVTAAHLIDNYSKIIDKENKALEEMKTQAKTNPDEDLKAKIVLKENTISQLSVNKAQLEQRNYAYKLQKAEEIKNQYRDLTGQMLIASDDAKKNPAVKVSEADQNEVSQMQIQMQTQYEAFQALKARGKDAPPADLAKAEAAFLMAQRKFAEKSMSATRLSQTENINKAGQKNIDALAELAKDQKDSWKMDTPALQADREYNYANTMYQITQADLKKNPNDPAVKVKADTAYTNLMKNLDRLLEGQLEDIKKNTDRKGKENQGWKAEIDLMEKQNSSAKITVPLSEESQKAKNAIDEFNKARPNFKPPATNAPLADKIAYEKDSIQLIKLERAFINTRWDELQSARGNMYFPGITKPIKLEIKIAVNGPIPQGQQNYQEVYTPNKDGKFELDTKTIMRNWNGVMKEYNQLNSAKPGEEDPRSITRDVKQRYEPPTTVELAEIKATAKLLFDANRAYEASPTEENQKKWMEATVAHSKAVDTSNKGRIKRTEEVTLKDVGAKYKDKLKAWKKEIGDLSGKTPDEIAKKLADMMKAERESDTQREFDLEAAASLAESLNNVPGVREAYKEFLDSVGGPKVLLKALESIESPMIPNELRDSGMQSNANMPGADSNLNGNQPPKLNPAMLAALAQANDPNFKTTAPEFDGMVAAPRGLNVPGGNAPSAGRA